MVSDGELSYEELNYAVNKISSWYNDTSKSLNVFTLPYNTTLIFINIILKVIGSGGKVLYVYSKRSATNELLNKLDKRIKCSYLETKGSNLTFINYKKINNIKNKYELAIIDEVSAYCSIKNKDIEDIYGLLKNVAKRNIIYSIEDKINICNQLEIPSIYRISPLVEPRIINTRVNLTKEMPCILYDYFKWFEKNKKKVIIYVPDEEKLKLINKYYINKLNMHNSKFIFNYDINMDELKKCVLKIKNKAIFIVTDKMKENIEGLEIQDAIVLFADDSYYNYKSLIFLCANMENKMDERSEVLFVSKHISYDMDKVKNMAREFNKVLWEKKLLNL